MSTYADLDKLDHLLGSPVGTTRQAIARNDPASIRILNEYLVSNKIEITVDEDGFIPQDQKLAWKGLMQRAGIGRSWWLTGDTDIDLPDVPTD